MREEQRGEGGTEGEEEARGRGEEGERKGRGRGETMVSEILTIPMNSQHSNKYFVSSLI